MVDIEKLKKERKDFFNQINDLCEDFWKKHSEEELHQFEMESFFGTLWRRLERLFDSQHWDFGEFRKKGWEELEKVV